MKNIILLANNNSPALKKLQHAWQLDHDIFTDKEEAAEISQLAKIENSDLYLLTFFGLKKEKTIEASLVPIIAVFNKQKLALISAKCLFCPSQETDPIKFLLKQILFSQEQIRLRLTKMKVRIDSLDKNARRGAKASELEELTNVTRELVFLQHTLDDQNETLMAFFKLISEAENDSYLIAKAKRNQRRLNKMIHIYRDLLDSVSSLLNAMMDSHLNNLMKYLDSFALIIAIPTLITGILGMNVGGVPGKNSSFAFLIVMIIALIATLITAFFLRRKNYFK